jgi:hypothetical protein
MNKLDRWAARTLEASKGMAYRPATKALSKSTMYRRARPPMAHRYPKRPTQTEWASILELQGFIEFQPRYWINRQGDVYFLPTTRRPKLRKKVLTPISGKYTRMCIGSSKYVYLHRVLAQCFIPNPENKPCINHIDFDRSNNSLDNLEWVTYKENSQHAIAAGRGNVKSTTYNNI